MDNRAQTQMDFLIGMTVFLLAVGFVFSFIPTMFDPFTGQGVDNDLVADRSAAQLAEQTLVSDSMTPNMLSSETTTAFFEDCPVKLQLGIDSQTARIVIGLNDGPAIVNETRLAYGETPPLGASVSVSQRLVSLGGDEYLLSVRVW